MSSEKGDVDLISVFIQSDTACIQVFNIEMVLIMGMKLSPILMKL